jgi:hypothetical protein
VIVVVVFAGGGGFTVWGSVSELPVNDELPWYAAVMVVVPLPGVNPQLPCATVALQPPPPSALTKTVPSGDAEGAVTVNVTVIGCPAPDGSGPSPVIVVVVPVGGGGGAGFTVWVSVAELVAKLEFPWKVAVRVLVPTVLRASEQLPAPPAIGTVHSSTPSLTVAVPSGVASLERTLKATVNACPGIVGSGLSTSKRVLVLLAAWDTVTA